MDPSWAKDWSVGLRVWVERGGHAVLGQGRLELLEGIERWHSISAAARHMGMSYRRAWQLVQSINGAAGEPLVTAAPGGEHGGGAKLTALGRWAIGVFGDLQQQIRLTATVALTRQVQHGAAPVLHLAVAASLEDVVREVLGAYALQQPTVQVQTALGASDEMANHVLAGAAADLFLSADAGPLDRLEEAGLVVTGTRFLWATTTLAAITQRDRELPVSRPTHLKKPEAGRIALAGAASPTGRYTRAYLDDSNLMKSLESRALWVENSRAVVAAIRARQADIGLVYASDAFRADGCRILFQIRRLPVPVEFSAARISRGHESAGADQLLQFLTSAVAATCLRRCGFAPSFTASRGA